MDIAWPYGIEELSREKSSFVRCISRAAFNQELCGLRVDENENLHVKSSGPKSFRAGLKVLKKK